MPPVCIPENSDSQKIVTIDRKFNLSEHVTNLCDKASKKIQALARIFVYVPETQKRLLIMPILCLSFFFQTLIILLVDQDR